jgi:hypothetical protein
VWVGDASVSIWLQSPTGASPHGASAVVQLLFRPCGTHLRTKQDAKVASGQPFARGNSSIGLDLVLKLLNCDQSYRSVGHNITVGRRYQAETAAGPIHPGYPRGLGVTAVTVDGDPFHSSALSTGLI